MKPSPHQPGGERTVPPFKVGRSGWRGRLANLRLRDLWWRLLDFFEAHRAARIGLCLAAMAMVLGFVAWFWAYPAWERRNSVRIARKWLEAGQLRYAAEAAQRAAQLAPDDPEPWTIAAELARRGGQFEQAADYSRRAAELSANEPESVLAWAADALRAGRVEECNRALDLLPPAVAADSAHAQRLRGEIARRQLRLDDARGFFEAAARLEGPQAVNEVPLGLILLNAADAAERRHGSELLIKWSTDADWGATALRTLLDDAILRQDRPGMLRWAEALRTHPRCTVGDMPRCLLALSQADPERYAGVLAQLQRDHAVSPQAAAQLLSWLNQIGRGSDAARWMKTLPPEGMNRPPLVVAGAEALRQSGDWRGLQDWCAHGDWGREAEFMRWTYGLIAARNLGEEARADELLLTLQGHAQLDGVHGHFAASMLYGWGWRREAESLWRLVAEQDGSIAVDALGSLARLYQVERNADGQYRAFRRLHLLRPTDAAIGNNFAFFAALTRREQQAAEKVARANLEAEPGNDLYLATCAFTLLQQSRVGEALDLLRPKAAAASRIPALAFAYGLALAQSGNKAEARPLLASLPPDTLTTAEVDLITAALAD
jgi:Flp pilus assembly protein TadD